MNTSTHTTIFPPIQPAATDDDGSNGIPATAFFAAIIVRCGTMNISTTTIKIPPAQPAAPDDDGSNGIPATAFFATVIGILQCRCVRMNISTTTIKIPPAQPAVTDDDDGSNGIPATAFFAAIIGILLVIVVFAIFAGKYRLGQNRQRWRGPNSPSIIYSVTMHGAGNSSFINTVEGFLRESRRLSATERGTINPGMEQTDITNKPITGLPTYEESVNSFPVCPSRTPKDELPPPPPYSAS